MEELNKKKRVRDDSDESLEGLTPRKRVILDDSDESELGGLSRNKRAFGDPECIAESELDSPEVKRLGEDLFDNLDDSDLCTGSQDLDSFMRSFEEEIRSSSPVAPPAVEDPTSDSCPSRPELGYLWEASDDELGLPPSTTTTNEVFNREESELVRVASDSSELSELWLFEDQVSGYESFEFGIDDGLILNNNNNNIDDGLILNNNNNNNNGEYFALDGLFDYSDSGYGVSDFSWRHEKLPTQ